MAAAKKKTSGVIQTGSGYKKPTPASDIPYTYRDFKSSTGARSRQYNGGMLRDGSMGSRAGAVAAKKKAAFEMSGGVKKAAQKFPQSKQQLSGTGRKAAPKRGMR